MITRATLSTIEQGLPKYRSMLAGNTAFIPSSYESIATVTVGSGGSSSISFNSIATDWTHLQVRAIMRGSTSGIEPAIRFNSDTGNNYARHRLQGNGTSAVGGGDSNVSRVAFLSSIGLPDATSTFATIVVDILDYKNTSKYKTVRLLDGVDNNGSGNIELTSGLWMNTNAITSITILCDVNNFAQYSHFALYGIKGA